MDGGTGSGRSDSGRRLFAIELSRFSDYVMIVLFLIGVILCTRFAVALLWEKDYPNLQLYSDTLCAVGIAAWMIFVIVGWVRHYSGAFRWRLITVTVLVIMDSVLFGFGYGLISLVFAVLIFLLFSLYFYSGGGQKKWAEWISRKVYPENN